MKISLIFGENSTKCGQNIAKNARYWRYLSILNLLLRIPKTPKAPLWVRFPPGTPKQNKVVEKSATFFVVHCFVTLCVISKRCVILCNVMQ